MAGVKLPGLTDTEDQSAQDAFQAVADDFNVALAAFVSEKLNGLLEEGDLPKDASGAGPTVVAAVAAIINCAGRLCGSFEPHINGDVMASVVEDQFNAGRADHHIRHGGSVQ